MRRISVLDSDTTTLPNGLLNITKRHLRVSSSQDDEYIKSVIARSIAWFETATDTHVNPVELQWWPTSDDFTTSGRAVLPETPVNVEEWSVVDAGNVDFSDDYEIISSSSKGVGVYSLVGDFFDDMSVKFTCGYDSVAAIPAGVLNAVLLYAGHIYENREVMVPGTLEAGPGWLTHVIAPWWKPSV